jgi:predicted 2-oxoglutarate/Fe(II)-dependent dioxygenase YbiX
LLYNNQVFRSFVSKIVQQEKLYPYADPLSAVNVHFHKDGQELGWHFDNSDFAVTILIQKPSQGGVFEYVSNIRDDQQEHTLVEQILNQERTPQQLNMQEGSLVIFRGRRSLHRVTPSRGSVVRLVAVLAYNAQPGVKLSESARETFYGRLE